MIGKGVHTMWNRKPILVVVVVKEGQYATAASAEVAKDTGHGMPSSGPLYVLEAGGRLSW